MKKEFKLGYLDWILNKPRYIDLYLEKQDKVQELILQKRELEEDLIKANSDFLAEKENMKAKIDNLQKQLTDKTNRVLVLDKAVNDRNREIQELHFELSKVNLKLDEKIKAFNKLRGEFGALKKKCNKLISKEGKL